MKTVFEWKSATASFADMMKIIKPVSYGDLLTQVEGSCLTNLCRLGSSHNLLPEYSQMEASADARAFDVTRPEAAYTITHTARQEALHFI